MNLSEEKQRFRRAVVQGGVETADEATQIAPDGSDWLRAFNRKPIEMEGVPTSPRLVNHFALGADPEFGFLDANNGTRVDAANLALCAGVAFGADNNGRLAELRPQPSRFVLDIVASLLVELRWLYVVKPASAKYQWMSTPVFEGDGLGGHVHFGRKRPQEVRVEEIRALDTLYKKMGMFFSGNAIEARRRAPGHYGQPGDVRAQKHGYEYRSWPTWLESPWLAYFHLTLAKLAAFDPELLPKEGLRMAHITNLLTYYQNRDDDACIAKHALARHGFPKCVQVPLQEPWGIPLPAPRVPGAPPAVTLFPSFINASEREKAAIFGYLVKGYPVPWEPPVPYWETLNPPRGFVHALDVIPTLRAPGIGELFNGLVFSKEYVFTVVKRGAGLVIGSGVPRAPEVMKRAKVELQVGASLTDARAFHLSIGDDLLAPYKLPQLRTFLLSGLLPLWRAGDASTEAFEKWKNSVNSGTKLRGRALEVA